MEDTLPPPPFFMFPPKRKEPVHQQGGNNDNNGNKYDVAAFKHPCPLLLCGLHTIIIIFTCLCWPPHNEPALPSPLLGASSRPACRPAAASQQ